jgi:Tol biopolymer transport system component
MQYLTKIFARLSALLIALALIATLPAELKAQYFQFGKNKVQYASKDWYYVQSQHFDVYYYEPGGKYLASFAAEAAEDAYTQIADDFEYQISDRIPLLVYQSHNDFAVTNAVDLPSNAEGIGGVTELFKNRVAIPFTGDYRDFRRVIHHELVHAVINDMFYGGSIQSIIQNNITLRIPTWFNEGLAEYQALGWDSNSDMYVRDAVINDYLAPIPQLRGYFAYRGGQSVFDYIAEQYGEEKIGDILQNIRLTRSVDGAFRRSTGLSLRELSERWHKTLEKVYYPEMSAREDLSEIADLIVTREDGMAYSTSPAISPQGNHVAFISTKGGFFDVYLARTDDGKIIRKLVDGQDNTRFESLKILDPNITWSPDGQKIALATKSGRGDAIAVIDVQTGETTHYRVPEMDAIVTVAWHPDGEKIAFEGSRHAQSDIYVLDLETKETVNYTNDLFSDHEPTWSPDGEALVFHSDRGEYTYLGTARADSYDMIEHDYSQFDLYKLTPGDRSLERLSYTQEWDEKSAKFGNDSNRMLFISDRNGTFNLYEKNMKTGADRPLTDVLIGVTQVSVSADGSKAALVSLNEGTPSIYVLKRPFERSTERDPLQPTVWAQRVIQDVTSPAPALQLASSSLRQNNPILRDASDGTPFVRTVGRHQHGAPTPLLAKAAEEASDGDAAAEDPEHSEEEGEESSASGVATDTSRADTTEEDPGTVDFRNYVFSEGFEDGQEERPPSERRATFSPEDNKTEDGDYKEKQYKLSFSPDIIYGTAGYDMLYGVQGVTQMVFSDMLGNHQIFVATNLLIDLRNSDYYVSYNYRPQRIDWSILGYHTARLLPDYRRRTYVRYRNYGGGISLKYPLDKFRRFDIDMSLLGINRTDIGNPEAPAPSHTLMYPSVTYTKDNTTPGMLFPTDGHRYAMSLSGSPGSLQGANVQFATGLMDWRWYQTFGQQFTFAFRGSAGASFGPDPQLFYTAGVSNWLNRRFDPDNGFPIYDVTDFLFATPVMPLRGSNISTMIGSKFGLFNAEFRYPLVAAMIPGPLPLPLYNLQGAFFLDAGTVFGSEDNPRFNLFEYNAQGQRVYDDLIVGTGFGLRTILLGYPVRLDWAWPFNGRSFGDRRIYFSIGLDF